MRPTTTRTLMFSLILACTAACSDDETNPVTTTVTSGAGGDGASSTTQSGGSGGAGAQGGQGGQGAQGGDGGQGGAGGEPFMCTAAREAALGPIDAVSTGDVTVLDDTAGVREIYVDASAGGFQMASMNPAIYLDLASATRIDVTDLAAFDADSWDIALKRVAIRNNSAHAGGGDGGAAFLAGADFAAVTLADATGATLEEETWFDDQCAYEMDATGALLTTMSEWYDYDPQMMTVSPKDGVYVVRGADGQSYFKLQIVEYYADPDGTPGLVSGRYVLRVAALE